MAVLNGGAVADELAIRDLVARFTDTVNRRASGALGALFVPDGEWIVPGVPPTRGPDAVSALLEQLLGGFGFLVQLVHSGNVRIDGDRASARWYLSEVARDESNQGWSFIGTYHDQLVRTADGWRFASRQFDFLYRGRTELPGRTIPFTQPTNCEVPWPD